MKIEISKKDYESADRDKKMEYLYDFQEFQNEMLTKIFTILKGNGKRGMIVDLEILKSRVVLLTILCFSILGLVKWG